MTRSEQTDTGVGGVPPPRTDPAGQSPVPSPDGGNPVTEPVHDTTAVSTGRGPARTKDNRISGLDGLRAVAIGIVMISHYVPVVFPRQPWLETVFPGMFGVYVFFVISGLLICRLLLVEHERTAGISLKNFYTRRLLRLTPALWVYVLVTCLAYLVVDGHVNPWAFVSAATYTGNYYDAAGHYIYGMPVWSLAVEEHFYLLFPAVLILALRRRPRRTVTWAFVAALAVLAWRVVLALTTDVTFGQVYLRTDTRLDSLMFGVGLALVMWFYARGRLAALIRSNASMILGIVLIAISVVIRDDFFRITLRNTLQGVGLLLIIGYIVYSNRSPASVVRRVLDWAPLRFIGTISYSLYLWHLTLLFFFVHVTKVSPLGGVAVGVLSFGFAIASYYLIERPFLGLRRRFGSHANR